MHCWSRFFISNRAFPLLSMAQYNILANIFVQNYHKFMNARAAMCCMLLTVVGVDGRTPSSSLTGYARIILLWPTTWLLLALSWAFIIGTDYRLQFRPKIAQYASAWHCARELSVCAFICHPPMPQLLCCVWVRYWNKLKRTHILIPPTQQSRHQQ